MQVSTLSSAAGIALVDLDLADRVGFAGVFRAVLAPRPGGADAADVIEPGIEARRQFDRDFAGAGGEPVDRFRRISVPSECV